MSPVVHVDLKERSYAIKVGRDLPVGESLAGESDLKALVISDTNVDPLYGATCESKLRARGLEVWRAVVPAGERSKSLTMAAELYRKAVNAGLDRRSVVVALGGGMVGDLAGFVAGTYLRGIRFIQIPTSLLAMVDSSVGGKTGVNLEEGKNLVGVFHQPIEVVADLNMLTTLPEREYRSGLAEVVKYGAIWDAAFLDEIEAKAQRLVARDLHALESVIARCCEIKAEVVKVDEREAGVRAILNFGHTFAHALEQTGGYCQWLHGEAVAIGMVYAAELSRLSKGLAPEAVTRLGRLLRSLKIVQQAAAEAVLTPDLWPKLRAAMGVDKKVRGGMLRFVLAERLGAVVFGCTVPEEDLEKAYEMLRGELSIVASPG